ncbi:RNA methyltransferase [soil metagenome]
MTLPPQDLSCFAVVTPGLEPFAIAEAEALGLEVVAEPGGFAWQGSAESALVANVGLRIASRVLVRLASFEARSFAELERHARKIAWARVIAPGESVRFRVTCKKSKLYHSDAVAQRLADAVKRALPGVRAEGASIGEDDTDDALEDAALIVVRVMRDRCTVSADSSGALLHRRGYRLASTKAPLRETIAAGMLAASGWDAALPLVDPLCGSGTIPIEAALLARGIAPGAQRTFAMERWPTVDASLREAVRDRQAGQTLQSGRASIAASDRDSGAIAASRENAQRAGVGDDIAFWIHALSAAVFPNAPLGWVVTNPPYGVRVGDADRVRDLWAQLGNVLRERASGWRLAVLSPDAALDRQLRIPVRAAAALSNGGIPVRIMVGEIP